MLRINFVMVVLIGDSVVACTRIPLYSCIHIIVILSAILAHIETGI